MFFKLELPLGMATATASNEGLAAEKENCNSCNEELVGFNSTDLSSKSLNLSEKSFGDTCTNPEALDTGSDETPNSVNTPPITDNVSTQHKQTDEQIFNRGSKIENNSKVKNGIIDASIDPPHPGPDVAEETRSPVAEEEDYFGPLKRLGMRQENKTPPKHAAGDQDTETRDTPCKQPLKSFSISDILRYNPISSTDSRRFKTQKCPVGEPLVRIVRPWDTDDDGCGESDDNMSISSASSGDSQCLSSEESRLLPVQGKMLLEATSDDGNPLDALFQMTSKTFDELRGAGSNGSQGGSNLFSKHQAKKKRKSRTAFSNHQIFELEKRFLYQKYLSPADRDELSQKLGLSNAQVITWFQNRRAKLKRDMEELKKDHTTAAIMGDHRIFFKTMTQMGLLKTKLSDHFECRK